MTALFRPPAPVPPKPDRPWWRVLAGLRRNPLATWSDRAYEEPAVSVRLLGRPYIVLAHPGAIRHVLVDNAANYRRPVTARRLLRPGTGEGLLLAEGAVWRQQRRMLSPAFTPRAIDRLFPHFHAGAARLVETLGRVGPRVNLAREFQRATLDIAARAMFSVETSGRGAALDALLGEFQGRYGRPTFWDILARHDDDFPWFERGRRAFSRRWFAEIDGLVAERLTRPPAEDAKDVLDLLLAARDPDTGQGLAPDEVRNQIATFLGAGFETTARGLFWTLYLLAQDPAGQDAIRAELAALGGGPRTLADLDKLPRLRAAWLETLRLYPPAPIMTRRALAADDAAGIEIPAGAELIIAPWLLHRHRAYWRDPEIYDPGRFAPGWEKRVTRDAFIPFGLGPRVCIGAAFATAEAAVMLAALLGAWRVTLADDRPVMPVAQIATVPSIEPWFALEPLDQAAAEQDERRAREA
jgi:cytochrome P450